MKESYEKKVHSDYKDKSSSALDMLLNGGAEEGYGVNGRLASGGGTSLSQSQAALYDERFLALEREMA